MQPLLGLLVTPAWAALACTSAAAVAEGWLDVGFGQQQGQEKGSEMPGEGRGTEELKTGLRSMPLPSPARHPSWQIFPVPWVIISLPLPLGETASPQLFWFLRVWGRESRG